jgi:hypothetical protein
MKQKRKQHIELIREITSGKKLLPWDGKTILWTKDNDGNFVYKAHVVSQSDFDSFTNIMGGKHLCMAPDNDCKPIGTIPDEVIETRSIGKRIKEVVSDLFHIEQHPEQRIEQKRKRVMEGLAERRERQEQERKKKAEPIPGHDFITAGFRPTVKHLEIMENLRELNMNIRNYGI